MLAMFCPLPFLWASTESLVPLPPKIPFIRVGQGWNAKLKVWPTNHKAAKLKPENFS